MAKDPAFLFYDGDAARDVSHMNRLERGCYFDLIQAQKKFGGCSMEQIRKILGKDFDDCWPGLEMVLTKDESGIYFIEWVKNSIEDRKVYAEKNRKRIQDYWDKKKNNTKEDPRKYHGNSNELPYINEIENENEDVIVNEDKGGVGEKETSSKSTKLKPEKIEIVLPFISENFKEAWGKWIKHRKEIGKPYKSLQSEELTLKKLSEFDEQFAIGLIERSISNGYQGLIFDSTKKEYLDGKKNRGNNASKDLNSTISLGGGTKMGKL